MRCCNCGKEMHDTETQGYSSIYGASEYHLMCEPCFFEEEALIDERGSNDHPDRLKHYDSRDSRKINYRS